MADTGSKFLTRVISALMAVSFLFSLGYFGGNRGLYLACTLAIVLGIREYSRMAFGRWQMPNSVTYLFWSVSLVFYILMIDHFELGLLWFAMCSIMFIVGCLWLTRDRVDNEQLLPAIAVGSFGMLYCVLFPFFCVELVKLDTGASWFVFLLLLVFSGDTFAYFGGRFLGKRKFMPQISPNKTWEGSACGLIGSAVVGTMYLSTVMPQVSWYKTAVFCLLCGFAAQTGDLLMSLVKRVAQVKDSGGIMPGHGGVLDRLDGIFIACPLVYAFALYVNPYLGPF